jgi:hypothetical protein
MMKLFILSALAVALLAARSVAAEQAQPAKSDTRVFEIRTYYAAPGKMKDLHARFRDHTCKLLEKYGMTLIGFWTPTDPKGAEEVLIYIVAHPSEDAAKKSWDAFRKDPDWIKARADSEKNGALTTKVESKFYNPTDYSKTK